MYSEERIDAGSFRYREENRRSRSSNLCRGGGRGRLLVALGGCLAVLVLIVVNVQLSSQEVTETTQPDQSLFFFEKEAKAIEKRKQPNPEYIKPPRCYDFGASTLSLEANQPWEPLGEEQLHSIKNVAKANLAGGHWSNHFGYGHRTALSGDGHRLAVAYEGRAGFDHTFGMHIDVFAWNTTHWELEQTLTDVVRGHSHSRDVRYQSLAISSNGERIVFSDGHGVYIFDFDATADKDNLEEDQQLWIQQGPILDKTVQAELLQGKQRQFGTNIALNCDGSVIAVSGENERYSYTKIFQQEDRERHDEEEVLWAELGEIQGVKFGGSIAMNNLGTHIAIGTVASQSWKGMVQIWQLTPGNWHRLGQPILGDKPLEKWGGRVVLSADGNTVVSTAKDGASNSVAAYRFSETYGYGMWKPMGEILHGTINNKHERFGSDIALSHDGKTLAVGAQGDKELYDAQKEGSKVVPPGGKKFLQGRIYIYRLDDSKSNVQWVEIGEVVNGWDGDTFGRSVALSATGSFVAGGAPTRKGKAYQQYLGSARVFQATEL